MILNQKKKQQEFNSNYYQPDTTNQYVDYQQQQQQQNASYYDPSSFNITISQNPTNTSFYPNPHSTPMLSNQPQPLINQSQQLIYPSATAPVQANSAQMLFNNPMLTSMAVDYSAKLADEGKAYVAQNVDKWFSISKLKFYFAVDTIYVKKKLLVLLFPFLNKDWSVKYNQNEAVPPVLDVNAPDMYIPVMSFLTYILVLGIALGSKDKFSPEILGMNASSALGWFLIEVALIYVSLHVLSVKSMLKTFDIMAFCGYKYFGMILCIIAGLAVSNTCYYCVLGYTCLALTYFMIKNLKLLILVDTNPSTEYESSVPLFMWWLTWYLV